MLIILCSAFSATCYGAQQAGTPAPAVKSVATIDPPATSTVNITDSLRQQADAVSAMAVHKSWQPLIVRLRKDGFDDALLTNFFARLTTPYSSSPMGKKMREMYYRKFTARKKKPSKKTAKPEKPRIYKGVIVPQNITRAKKFLQRHKDALTSMEQTYGVPREIAVGLMLVETRLGAYLGKVKAFQNLACLASTTSMRQVLPHLKGYKLTSSRKKWLKKRIQSKSDWAYKELGALIRYSKENNLDPVNMPGSIYGAVGICQFMPSNILHFGVDGDGDGRINLFHVPDAIHSLANYLKQHGWKPNLKRASQHKVLYRYNHSTTYANTILAVAEAITDS